MARLSNKQAKAIKSAMMWEVYRLHELDKTATFSTAKYDRYMQCRNDDLKAAGFDASQLFENNLEISHCRTVSI